MKSFSIKKKIKYHVVFLTSEAGWGCIIRSVYLESSLKLVCLYSLKKMNTNTTSKRAFVLTKFKTLNLINYLIKHEQRKQTAHVHEMHTSHACKSCQWLTKIFFYFLKKTCIFWNTYKSFQWNYFSWKKPWFLKIKLVLI